MLTAPLIHRRLALRICAIGDIRPPRPWAGGRHASNTSRPRRSIIQQRDDHARKNAIESAARGNTVKVVEEEREANLYEQLFGASTSDASRSQWEEKEVPRIPLEDHSTAYKHGSDNKRPEGFVFKSGYELLMERDHAKDETQISVLVLRNAGKNLAEDDFKRLVPQGSHLEGWTLEKGDIIKVIPGRDPATLEQSNFYYLLFSSKLSAFAYQGHATRVYRIVAAHTPSSIVSPILPPPGVTVRNMDANTAIQSFSLVAPNHPLDLRQLKPPLTPVMQAIVRNQGYPFFVSRKDRMPYEARLTLEGPQMHESTIRHFFYKDGKQRGLSWSGDDKANPTVTKWVNPDQDKHNQGRMSAMSKKPAASTWGKNQEVAELKEWQTDSEHDEVTLKPNGVDRDYAVQFKASDRSENAIADAESAGWVVKPHDAFIIGFTTERAMQSFVHYWHRRPMQTEGFEQDQKADLPPIINVEALW